MTKHVPQENCGQGQLLKFVERLTIKPRFVCSAVSPATCVVIKLRNNIITYLSQVVLCSVFDMCIVLDLGTELVYVSLLVLSMR